MSLKTVRRPKSGRRIHRSKKKMNAARERRNAARLVAREVAAPHQET